MAHRRILAALLLAVMAASVLAACAPAASVAPATATTIPTPSPTPAPTAIPYTTPAWFQHAVVYEIYVRSFADSDGDGIGDLQGVAEKLEYLDALGVDVIWLMPIYPSPSVHGYDVTDFFDVHPDYGSLADLDTLLAAVHARGMRLILDFVPSHLSDEHPLFQEAYNNPGAANTEWFVFTNEAHTRYASFAENLDMPRFNHYNPEVVEYLTEAALFWLARGVDGFRVDNVTFPPTEFFVSLRQSVKSDYPDALLLGEAWVTDPRSLSIYYTEQFDALFDFPLYNLLQALPNGPGDGILNGRSSTILVNSLFKEQAGRYPQEGLSLRFLSNHDTDRIASEVRGDAERQRLAASLLGALPGPVLVYYGEELGMPGRKCIAPHYDSCRRAPMEWTAEQRGDGQPTWFMDTVSFNVSSDGVSYEEQHSDPNSLLNHYRHILSLYASTPGLQSSHIAFPAGSWSGQGGLAFVRGEGEYAILAVFNFSDEALTLELEAFPLPGEDLNDLLSGAAFTGAAPGAPWSIELPARGALWLTASD
ncbi:MAG: alpha-glucosidase C-terminal domain-containing protein [Anaerolineales bacterium]|nr:alpha-glucosidase C-terminal domain-containing protein [Anaerolineales bacterium]